MRWKERIWQYIGRAADIYSLWPILGLGTLMAAVTTTIAALSDRAPTLTSVGWIFVFFAAAICSVSLLGIAGWAYHRWRFTPAGPLGAVTQGTFGDVSLQMQKPASHHDFVVTAIVKLTERSDDLVLFGRWAKAVFLIDGTAKWRWTQSKRLLEHNSVHQGEQFSAEVLRRPADGEDRVLILEDSDTLGGAGSSNLYQVELVLCGPGNKRIVRRQCYQFIPINSGKISQPVSLDDVRYIREGQ